MFGKNKNNSNVSHDIDVMMQMMDKVIQGEYDEIDVTAFDNPAYGEKLNELIHAFKKSNNNFVMRLNEAMESIGDNSYVKNTLDQVQSQTDSIAEMEEASHNLEESINNISKTVGGIQDNTHEMLAVAQNSTANMNESIKVVNQSSENISRINEQVQEFQDKIDKISEIVDIVKKVASQSNLLALNASIEAARAGENGKGFAVVAEQIRELADQSRESTEHINQIVNGLIENSNISVETAKKVSEAFEKQDAKIKDTEAIFATLNSEINRVGSAVSGIAAEASDLEQHKNTIAYGVDNLAQFAEENASSGQITKENMNNLEQVMEQCKGSTDKIANVSAELVTQIKKFSGNGLKKR